MLNSAATGEARGSKEGRGNEGKTEGMRRNNQINADTATGLD